ANKSDASLIKGIIKDSNHEMVENVDDADSIVLLTCTVIDTTEQRMLSRLKKFKKTGKNIIVTGCMAYIQAELVKSVLPNAKLLPPQNSYQILDILENKEAAFVDKNKTLFPKYYENIIAPISIAEGCLFSCSYCITTKSRGKLKSYPIDEIIQDVNSAVKHGCKEIQLTAQDTSSYGLDFESSLGELLTNVSQIKGEYRIRVGMMNPYTVLKNIDSIIEGFDDQKIYKFLHIPVQSGDNAILKKMNRKYSVEEFLEIIKKFRDKYPDITISTDAIVGFPTETKQQFQHTIDLLKTVKPDITNITRFSARPHTKAKTMKGRVKTEIAKERSKILTDLCSKISKENNLKHIGKRYNSLIIERGKNNTFVGRAENYKPIVIKENIEIGKFVSLEVKEAAPTYLVGSIK
ncbi:MAG: tRNA (N(6)-L-threonylcarbamoyladenosine(37)-C(2))-methylthiotransferase, partial [Thermoplasmatales archaeon]|nr:tRNA (N(6)-L-threonylcarbamoyladenosine(37)-C(2))-methylthiotransferase [Thermoplasmatales archaeon]